MKKSTSHPHIIVVGAGIAGLTAAYVLRLHGISAKVIEASNRVGGRMTSDISDGRVIDRGAQFLSTEYKVIPDLLRQLGLSQHIRETSQYSAIARGGQPRIIRNAHPADSLTSGLLSLPAWLKLGWRSLRDGSKLRELPLSDYSRWAAFDSETASDWANREMGAEVVEYVYEPMLQGFYFQTPEETSMALALAVTLFGVRRAKTIALSSGLGILPTALAAGLDVKCDMPVSMIRPSNGKVYIETPSGQLQADRVILAVPAPVGLRILSKPLDILSARLLSTPYSASINVAVITDAGFDLPNRLHRTYGLLLPRSERISVAAVGIENNKCRGNGPEGHLINVMFSHESATRLMSSYDKVIAAEAMREMEGYFPSLSRHIKTFHVYRWPMAEPCSKVGRAMDLERYRKQCDITTPSVILAGDYMSMPFTDGAAESGAWAAKVIARSAHK
jgi:oxygen-dependent protoporphyrinogen oxidase